MRFLSFLLPFLLTALLVFLFGVPLVDHAVNRTRRAPTPAARDTTVHVPAVDLHSDVLLWNRDLGRRAAHGHVDRPRLREGGLVLQVFSATNSFPLGANYSRTPPGLDLVTLLAVCNRWPAAAWRSPPERALVQAAALRAAAERSAGTLRVVATADDLARLGGGVTGAILSVEGLHGLEGGLADIDRLWAAGYRIFGLVHMTDTAVAGSASGWRKGGLTAFGRRVVAHIDSLGGIIDLAHASPQALRDVLESGPRSVLVSHTGVDGTCPGNRNLSDEELALVAAAGGIVGIGFWKGAVCGTDEAAIARAVRYAAGVIGAGRVALGSDFDGAVTMPFDAAGVQRLVPALRREGFDEGEIAGILGGNALRFFASALPR